jgi:hypothetical protein
MPEGGETQVWADDQHVAKPLDSTHRPSSFVSRDEATELKLARKAFTFGRLLLTGDKPCLSLMQREYWFRKLPYKALREGQ